MASESKPRKAAAAAGPAPRAARRPARRSLDPEQSARLMIIGAVALVVIAALGFIGFGYYWSEIRPEGRTVVQVDDVKVSFAAMKRRMRYELRTNPAYFQRSGKELADATYQELLLELTLVSRAESELGIVVDDAERESELRRNVGVGPDTDQQTFAQRLAAKLKETGFTESEYRRFVFSRLLGDKVQTRFESEVPAAVTQAKIEVIATNDDATALQAIERVKAGEPWADVAKQLSVEPDVQATSGVREFEPELTISPIYSSFAFSSPIGEVSQPLPGAGESRYVVRVIERTGLPLTEQQKPAYSRKAFNDWLTEMRETKMRVVDKWTTDPELQGKAVADVIDDVEQPSLNPQPQFPQAPVQQQPPAQQPPAEQPPAQQPPPAEQPPSAQ